MGAVAGGTQLGGKFAIMLERTAQGWRGEHAGAGRC